jgi:tetratricopeptide (TPR) repeat protein
MSSAWIIEGNLPAWRLCPSAESLAGSRLTFSVLEAARTLERREGFMESLKGAMAAGALVGELKRNLELAMQLADRAARMGASAGDEELTPSVVKARALFQLGVIAMGQRNFKEAVRFFEQSLNETPTQATYLNMAYCFLQMKGWFTDRTADAIKALERCVELDPESELAVLAGKELARLGRL